MDSRVREWFLAYNALMAKRRAAARAEAENFMVELCKKYGIEL